MIRSLLSAASLALCLLAGASARAELELSPLLSDGAVLQREQPIPAWGRAAPGASVVAKLGTEEKRTRAGKDGGWQVVFAARPAGEALTLSVVAGREKAVVEDIAVGDVWVCSGQSNMEWPLRDTLGAEAEMARVDMPKLRHFKLPNSWSAAPERRLVGGAWALAKPETVGDFSGVGYYFGKRLVREVGVPVGLIGTNWGGSAIEAWMSPAALGKPPRKTVAVLRGMIADGEAQKRVIEKKFARWPGSLVDRVQGAEGDFSAARLDTNGWETIDAPGLWEEQGFVGVDGVVWYRKAFRLSAAEAGGEATLGLGRIDDKDTTWVNGQKVGSVDGYGVVRRYTLPAGVLREGLNTIAIRVEDGGGGGGIYSDRDLLFIQPRGARPRSLAGPWKIRPDRVSVNLSSGMNHVETALYNRMIHPLYRAPIKGVIWYQGESNANAAEQARHYAAQFQALISDWRSGWKQPELPFYWVQLASYESGRDTPADSPWAILRESQTAALSLPHTGQAITLDVGNAKDIHPRDKETVGNRLALIALHDTYGVGGLHSRGPVLESASREGNAAIVRFRTARGLATRTPGAPVEGFEVAGEAGRYQPAKASIRGSTVVVELPVAGPTAIRYAWDDNPEAANLEDRTGLPAEPFRSKLGAR